MPCGWVRVWLLDQQSRQSFKKIFHAAMLTSIDLSTFIFHGQTSDKAQRIDCPEDKPCTKSLIVVQPAQ